MGNRFETSSAPLASLNRPTYEKALREMLGKNDADKLISQVNLYGTFKKFPDALEIQNLLTNMLTTEYLVTEAVSEAIKINPQYYWALTMRGRTYRSIKRYDDALRDFDQAIEINPKYELALISRGKTNLLVNLYTKSIVDFNLVLELQPDNDWCLYLRGLNYKLLGQFDNAQTDFYNAIKISKKSHEKGSNDWYNTFNLALYSLAAGKTAQAHKLYQYLANYASSDIIQTAIRDLDDFLIIFPRHMQAIIMRQLLKLTK